jgi:hypothetical protein
MPDTDAHSTFADYERTDGNAGDQAQHCPHCKTAFSPDAAQTVIDKDGTSFTSIAATPANDGPFFCPACWSELETNRLANEYHEPDPQVE